MYICGIQVRESLYSRDYHSDADKWIPGENVKVSATTSDSFDYKYHCHKCYYHCRLKYEYHWHMYHSHCRLEDCWHKCQSHYMQACN